MHTRWIPVVTALGAGLVVSGCGNLASRADGGCQMTVRSADGWLISGVSIPVSRPSDGAAVTIGAVTYSADQADELSRAAQELDQARLQNCAEVYSPDFSTQSDAGRELFYGRVIAAADQLSQFGTALKKAKTAEEGLDAAKVARKLAARNHPPKPVSQPSSD